MPTPDASQFIQMQRLRALEARTDTQKTITHLYQPQVTTSGLTDFLPSFTNKFITGRRYTPIGFPQVVPAPPALPSGSAGTLQFTSSATPSYLKVDSKDSLYPGTSSFTISFYLKMSSIGPSFPRVFALSSDSENQILGVSIEGGLFYLWINDSVTVSFDYTEYYDSWHFINITGSSSGSRPIYVQIDGVTIESEPASNYDIPVSTDPTAALNIGSYPQDPASDEVSMTGYLSNFRWVVGQSILYSAKPSPPLPVIPSRTSLFLLSESQATAYVDSGTDSSNTVITLEGPTPPVWSSQVVT